MANAELLQMKLIELIGRRVRIEKQDIVLEGTLALSDSISAKSSNTVGRNWVVVTDKGAVGFAQGDGWKVTEI